MVTFATVLLWASLGADSACYPLHDAARSNDAAKIRRLLTGRVLGLTPSQEGENLDRTGDFGACAYRTPLMVAAEAGNLEAVRELLDRGADASVLVDDPQLGKVSAWCLALMSIDGRRVAEAFQQQLWLGGPEAACADDARLIWAVRHGTLAAVEYELHASASQKGIAFALDESIGRRDLDVVRPDLIGRLNDRHELAALQTAVRLGDTLSLTQLADAGARVANDHALLQLPTGSDHLRANTLNQLMRMTRLTTGQLSTLAWAALNADQLETLETLASATEALRADPAATLNERVELSVWKKGDESVLNLALASRHPERTVRALLQLGVELASGAAIARIAATGECPVAEALAAAGAELNQVDESCRTPAQIARLHGHPALARALEQATKGHPRLSNPFEYCAGTVDDDAKERGQLRCR